MKIGRREFLGVAETLALGAALAAYQKGEASPPPTNQVLHEECKEVACTPEKDERIEIILTGDVMLGRTVMTHSLDEVDDPTYPFHKVADTLKKADLVFVNLENPIVNNCKRIYRGLELCALPEMVKGLTYAGIDIVTLANNHTNVYGQEGINETVYWLKENGILSTGLGELVTKDIRGVKFGFLGFDYSYRNASEANFQLVSESKKEVDVLIVGVHWKGEIDDYYDKPTEKQMQEARGLIDAGADVIAGHGPHWPMKTMYINGKPVLFLGNAVFDQMDDEETREGLFARLIFEGSNFESIEELKIYMHEWAQPEFKLKPESVDPSPSPMFGKNLLKL